MCEAPSFFPTLANYARFVYYNCQYFVNITISAVEIVRMQFLPITPRIGVSFRERVFNKRSYRAEADFRLVD